MSIVRQEPHVTLATGTLVQPVGNINSITGIRLDEFNAMSGGFHYVAGGPFHQPLDLMIDDVSARGQNLHVGDTLDLGLKWHITGIVESGKLSRMFAQLEPLQEMFSATGKVTVDQALFAVTLAPFMVGGLWASRHLHPFVDSGWLRPTLLTLSAAAGSVGCGGPWTWPSAGRWR